MGNFADGDSDYSEPDSAWGFGSTPGPPARRMQFEVSFW